MESLLQLFLPWVCLTFEPEKHVLHCKLHFQSENSAGLWLVVRVVSLLLSNITCLKCGTYAYAYAYAYACNFINVHIFSLSGLSIFCTIDVWLYCFWSCQWLQLPKNKILYPPVETSYIYLHLHLHGFSTWQTPCWLIAVYAYGLVHHKPFLGYHSTIGGHCQGLLHP